jgi:Ca-activated chloride channel homolog
MNFEYPELLFALPLLGAVAIVYHLRGRANIEKRRFPFFIASVCLTIVALANPYWRSVPAREKIKGVDFILIADVSQSMFSNSAGKTTRWNDARKFIKTLLPSLTGSQVALIYFAGDAQIGSPFTSDIPAISLFLDSIVPGMTTQAGTRAESLADTLKQVLRFRPAGNLPVILLFSDGEFFDNTRGLERYVKNQNLRIFTYLCGDGKAPVMNYELTAPVPEAFTTTDDKSLRRLAAAGQGQFFRLSSEPAGTIVEKLDAEIQDLIVEGQSVPDYRPIPFLVLALLFLLLYQWLPIRTLKIQPALTFLLFFLATSLSMKAEESRNLFQEALEAAEQGKVEQALKKLKSLPADFYPVEKNVLIGNIHYQTANYEEAIRHYQLAIDQDPFHATARWNWEVTLKRRSNPADRPPKPREEPTPQETPEERNALLQYVDQLEKEQRQKSNRANVNSSEFAW